MSTASPAQISESVAGSSRRARKYAGIAASDIRTALKAFAAV